MNSDKITVGYPNLDIDRVAREVLNKLIEDKCNLEFIKSEINKKFSEDIRLTMIGVIEDEGVSQLVHQCAVKVYEEMTKYLLSDSFIREFLSSLTNYMRSSYDSELENFLHKLSELLLQRTEVGFRINSKVQLDDFCNEIFALKDIIRR